MKNQIDQTIILVEAKAMHGYNRFMENNQTSDTRRQTNDSQRVNPPNQ